MRNEKYYEYFDVGKNKDLIGKNALTENDLLIFENLKNYEIQQHKRGCIAMTIFFTIIVLIVFFYDIISGIIFLVLFAFIDFAIIKYYLTLKHLTPEFCDYGVVTDKFVKKEKGDDDYYVIISANNNLIKFKRTFYEYNAIEINDEVILFAFSNKNELLFEKKQS